MKWLKQAFRGLGTLPYVGEHPGIIMFMMCVVVASLATADRGSFGFLVGALAMTGALGPILLIGAHDRAEISDYCVKEKENETDRLGS